MLKLKAIAFVGLSFLTLSCIQKVEAIANKKVEPKIVKVVVVIQDPIVNGKRMHETFKTPGYSFTWNDPWQLTKDYQLALKEISHGAIEYKIVEIIDTHEYFTVPKKYRRKAH